MSKRCELQKEYFKQFGNYKGNGKYCDKYVSWLEDQISILRIEIPEGAYCSMMCCENKAVSIVYNEVFYECEEHSKL
jgi:hypothetical protein